MNFGVNFRMNILHEKMRVNILSRKPSPQKHIIFWAFFDVKNQAAMFDKIFTDKKSTHKFTQKSTQLFTAKFTVKFTTKFTQTSRQNSRHIWGPFGHHVGGHYGVDFGVHLGVHFGLLSGSRLGLNFRVLEFPWAQGPRPYA